MFHSEAHAVFVFAFLSVVTIQVGGQTPGLMANYNAFTNVNSFLNKDLVQKNFENELSEQCDASGLPDFNNLGENFWDSLSTSEGAYFKSIPTYGQSAGETISDEWNEYILYTGQDDWHVEWVQEAFDKWQTNYPTNRGNGRFKNQFGVAESEGTDLGPAPDVSDPFGTGPTCSTASPTDGACVGYEQVAKKATAYTFNFIEMVQLMQKAIDEVDINNCIYNSGIGVASCSTAMEAWEAAVAIYTGSLEGSDGNNCSGGCYGYSLYALADKRCDDYSTCGPTLTENKDETAYINSLIITYFTAGQAATNFGLVDDMKYYKRMISAKVAVPLVQGVLKYTWLLSLKNPCGYSKTDKEIAAAGTFSSALLPKVWACSKKGADQLQRNLKIGGNIATAPGKKPSFRAVRLALECNYRCLGIKCTDVGSLFDGDFNPRMTLCDDVFNGSDDVSVSSGGLPDPRRKKACKRYTGKPGISGRTSSDYFVNGYE